MLKTMPARVLMALHEPLTFDVDGELMEFPEYSLRAEGGSITVCRNGSVVKTYEAVRFPADRDVYNFVASDMAQETARRSMLVK